MLYTPSVVADPVEEGVRPRSSGPNGHLVRAEPDSWVLVSAYVSREAFTGASPAEAVPTVRDVIALYPWLAR